MTSLPNILTFSRIAVIPLIVILFFIPMHWAAWGAFWLYVAACVTDWLDGFLARRMKVVSDVGRFLDPIADKLLVATLLFLFAATGRLNGIHILPAVVILLRELTVSGLREYLGPKGIIVPVSKLAKWKTASQMVALALLIPAQFGPPWAIYTGLAMLWISAALTVQTGWDYIKTGLRHMTG